MELPAYDDLQRRVESKSAIALEEADGGDVEDVKIHRPKTVARTFHTNFYQTSVIPVLVVRHEGASPVTMSLQEAFENHPIDNFWATFKNAADEEKFKVRFFTKI
ncbi:hypothetical protein HDU97_008923 [Phlyctochytrium planicorne]|nr:hypothetical protein HDU97_008923 [Phlyctochytrium planicorne]